MADKAARFSENLPLSKKLNFILPYATFHESRVNWRPLMFSKFFGSASSSCWHTELQSVLKQSL